MTKDKLLQELDNVTVIKFWADWCAPCKVIAPQLDEISTNLDIKLVAIDVNDSDELCNEFAVRNIPAIFVVDKELNVLHKHVGTFNNDKAKAHFEEALKSFKTDKK